MDKGRDGKTWYVAGLSRNRIQIQKVSDDRCATADDKQLLRVTGTYGNASATSFAYMGWTEKAVSILNFNVALDARRHAKANHNS